MGMILDGLRGIHVLVQKHDKSSGILQHSNALRMNQQWSSNTKWIST